MVRTFKVMLVALVILVIAGSAYAFAAANTGLSGGFKVGDGVGVVSGYAITNIVYTLNATDPSTLDSVSFDLGAAAATGKVKAQLVETTGDWYNCVKGTGTVWSCDTTGLTATSIDQLRVVAASQ